MQFIADNWQLVFGGLGTAIVAAIVGAWAKAHFDKKSAKTSTKAETSQKIRSGSHSKNVQAGRDANVDSTKT